VTSGGLSIDAASKLDETDNGLIVDYADANDNPALAVEALVGRGYNGGDWLGAEKGSLLIRNQ
jgi:hypothetical protein